MADVTDEVPIGHLLQSGSETHPHANRDGRREPLRLPLHQEIIAISTGKTMHSIRRCFIAAIFGPRRHRDHGAGARLSDPPGALHFGFRARQRHRRHHADHRRRHQPGLGPQAVLINQPGAGGAIGVRAAPHGRARRLHASACSRCRLSSRCPARPTILPVQVPHDFIAVGSLGGAPMFITAAPWLEVKTLPDLIALAQAAAGRARLWHQRAGPAHPSHRRIAAKPRRHKAPDGALFRRHAAGAQRHDGQARRARLRFLFGHRRRCRSQKRHPARGRGAQAHEPCFPTCRRSPKRCPAFSPRAGRCWWRRSARPTPSSRRSMPI